MSVAPLIVCAVDRSRRARRVAEVSRDLARALDARVVVVHVFDPMMVPVPPTRELHRLLPSEDVEDFHRQRARQALAWAAEGLDEVGHEELLLEGAAREGILGVVQERGARLVVTGSAARSPLDRILQGSVAAQIVAEAPCPVVVAPDHAAPGDDGPVVAAYDGSDHSLRAARHGAALAAGLGRPLVLVHVAESPERGVSADAELGRELHAAVRSCVSPTGGATARRLDVRIAVKHGEPVEQLLGVAHEYAASALVVGSRGRGAVKAAILGSVSAGLIHRADRPIVVAGPRSDEALTPEAP